MKITCLVDNCALDGFSAEHGLSLWIEATGHKLLFDTGETDAFLRNAERLGIDISEAEACVLSHGHHDHGGGLAAFLAANPTAPVYVHAGAFDKRYSNKPGEGKKYIGIDPALEREPRVVITGAVCEPLEGFTLFSDVMGNELHSPANDVLMGPDGVTPDEFGHEQNLLVREGDVRVLIAGCAHRGIVNIINRLFNIDPTPPTAVIGGFHLAIPGTSDVDEALVDGTAARLLAIPGTTYYTGHCTGLPSYNRLRQTMGDRIHYLPAGRAQAVPGDDA